MFEKKKLYYIILLFYYQIRKEEKNLSFFFFFKKRTKRTLLQYNIIDDLKTYFQPISMLNHLSLDSNALKENQKFQKHFGFQTIEIWSLENFDPKEKQSKCQRKKSNKHEPIPNQSSSEME